MNDLLTLARLQFGIVTIYHFFFVPLTIGLTLLVAIMETLYVRKNDPFYKGMAKFWGKLMLINFALGVVTGIVQEFQFGMAWNGFSRFIGDILGVPLASEALIAFFAESTFLGLWVFGWDRLSKKMHLATIWVVAIATVVSSFWILLVNSFMQNPVGYVLRNGRAEMESFSALLTNPVLWLQLPHNVASGLTTAGIFVLVISSYHLMKDDSKMLFRKSFKIGMLAAFVGLVLVMVSGDMSGKYLFKNQPMKMAAAEALWESKDPAPFSVVAIIDTENQKNTLDIEIPNMLSFLALNSFEGKVTGILEAQQQSVDKYGPGNYIPPVIINYISFRVMIVSAGIMLFLVLLAMLVYWRFKLDVIPLYFQLMMFMIPLPYLANSFGWILTEMGRQPWTVTGLLKTADAVSANVNPANVLVSTIGFAAVYSVLAIIDIYLLVKFSKKDPEAEAQLNAEGSISIQNKGKEGSMWI